MSYLAKELSLSKGSQENDHVTDGRHVLPFRFCTGETRKITRV